MKIAVCEDEALFRNRIVDEIEQYYHSLDVIVDSYESGEALIEKYEKGYKENKIPHYDILFLDIEMKKLDGFETAKKIRSFGGSELLVYLTSHTELAMQGYEVEAFRFLGKPLCREKLVEALQEAERKFLKEKTKVLHTTEQDILVSVGDILYAESMKNDIYYYVLEHKQTECVQIYKVREKITEAEQVLEAEGFFRCHRSYLIQLRHVVSYTNKEVTLQTGVVLPISRGKYPKLKEALIQNIQNSNFAHKIL